MVIRDPLTEIRQQLQFGINVNMGGRELLGMIAL